MTVVSILALGGAGFSLALGSVVLWRNPRSVVHWAFTVGMAVLAAEASLFLVSFEVRTFAQAVFWQRLSLLALALLPAPWLLFCSTFARDENPPLIKGRLALAAGASLLSVAAAAYLWDSLIEGPVRPSLIDGMSFKLGAMGKFLHAFFLVAAVGAIMNLERTFRASVGTIRWRIKFMLLGLGVLFVVRIYVSSQFLLFSDVKLSLLTVHLFTLPLACLLMAKSLAREGIFNVTVYPSRTVLQNSVTVLSVGIYLILVGIAAQIMARLGGIGVFTIRAFFILVALVGLTVLLMSDRVQQRTKILVSRHFRRPLHDYQKVWHTFTERTTSLMTESDLCRAATRLVSETFEVLSVTIWLIDESKDQLVFATSTLLSESKGERLAKMGGSATELKKAFSEQSYPVDIDESKQGWVEALKRCNPDYFQKGGHRVCAPLMASGRLLGLITIGDRVSGAELNVQDLDLLKCIADQVAANLLNIQLSQHLLQAKELEAFQTMSAFFVHDLKNTASTLSLTLKNLPTHFEDPAFRADALRAVGKSVERINALISRLSLIRQKLEMNLKEADLNEIVESVLVGLQPAAHVQLIKSLSPVPKVPVDQEQFQKVVTNLVLNAWDAVGHHGQGEVRVGTSRQNGWILLSVSDNGCGMTPEFMSRFLFRPFQTTKQKGIGIGMFHTKAIVEAHRGKIEVESDVGKGTTFRVLLPYQEKIA